MKNFILTLIFGALLSFGAKAQGSLQFNQVLLLSTNSNGQAWSVPSGKVWKVTSVSVSSNNSNFMSIGINGVSYWYTPNFSTDQGRFSLTLPLWLPAGTSLSLPFAFNQERFASVIEFNVVP